MEHGLINTIIASIVFAFIFGMVARKLRLPVIVGYLLAGVVIGPHTPGIVANVTIAQELAEIGILLLMFGVGLHFSFRDLMNVRKIALPGAIVQIISATVIGALAAFIQGYSIMEGLFFGFSLSVASTIVLLRSLEQRDMVDNEAGKIAVGWLIVEDIVMVFALVLLPVIASMISSSEPPEFSTVIKTAASMAFKISGFFAFMFVIGRRFLPWLLLNIAKMKSSELSTLGTLSIAFGFAYVAYVVFDASLALGAFLAGMVLGESEVGRKSAKNSLPMRDAFAVLFFVSAGMMFEPATMMEQPFAIIFTVLIIIFAKGAAAVFIMHCFKQPRDAVYTVAIGLAQIGEFSIILGGLALSSELLSQGLYNLILGGAILSIMANPFLFRLYDLMTTRKQIIS